MENFILIFICLAAGIILQRLTVFADNAPLTLNLYVIWIALPALILRQVPTLSFSMDLFILILMPWFMTGLGAVMVVIASRLFSWSREVTAVLLLTVPLGNTSFLGIPMIAAFFSTDMVSYGIIYDQFGSFLALATYGSLVLAFYSKQEQQGAGAITRRILTFPPFLALLTALLFAKQLQQPAIAGSLALIGSSLVPVVMFAIGLQLKIRLAPGQGLPFCFGLTVKLIIAPVAALLICQLLGLDTPASRIAIFEAGMPPMVTAGAMAMSAGLAPKLTAALVGWGILLSFASLSLLALFL
ncbi:MAG: AEC family transporter [Proteobacteria bacterium]|nr:AEC family transporter [Pseudomonadota bacterium]MBU1420324.1 AEC family transporter [Pseudomonadota bacterium]MBU1456550.1 AEC family transporter [Pseudomonadota bacterium]